MPFRRPLLAGSLLLVALASAACGAAAGSAAPSAATVTAAPTTAPATEAASPSPEATEAASAEPSGSSTAGRTGRIELPDDKVAITLPDGWVEVVLTGDDIETILSAFPEGTFDESQTELMRTAMQAGMRLMAFDSDGTGSNVSVLVQDAAVPVSLLQVGAPAAAAGHPRRVRDRVEDTTATGRGGAPRDLRPRDGAGGRDDDERFRHAALRVDEREAVRRDRHPHRRRQRGREGHPRDGRAAALAIGSSIGRSISTHARSTPSGIVIVTSRIRRNPKCS